MATSQVPFDYDMVLETVPRPLYTGKVGKTVVITSIHIDNTVREEYEIEFEMITPGRNTKGKLYTIKLYPGDWVLDDTPYRLEPTAAIWAKADKTTVKVFINGYIETVIA